MIQRFSETELQQLKAAFDLLKKYRYSDVFGDISGSLQKVIDIIEISSSKENNESYDFISPEKIPHIKGSEFLIPIIEAIKNRKSIRLYYQPYYEDKPYYNDINPYLLKEHKNRWYLVGRNDFKNQLRTYSLDRIRDIEESSVEFIETGLNAASYFKNSIGVIAPQEDPPKIRISVQKTQAQYMITQPWHDSQNIESENDDEIIFSFKVHPTYEFISLLLSYGNDLKVLEPVSIRELLKEKLLQTLKHYE